MLFNSYPFLLVFLPAALLIYWFADKSPRWRTWVLILLSLIFYSYWDIRFLPLLVASILLNWWAASLYAATQRHIVITAAIVANLVVLGIFKYTNFFADNLSALLGVPVVHFQLVLPLGISFFTFHHIMYLVDLGRGRAPAYPLDRYALYICFFPQAIAGPIARWNEVIHQFGHRVFAPGWEHRCAIGATFVIIGLVQKVGLADPLGRVIDPIFLQALTGPVTDGSAWLGLAFAFQIFFDFAGYSDIAIGLGLIFGVQLPRNFDAPFRASSIIELWQKWHMTLARFLRDYVFAPLSSVKIGGRKYRAPRQVIALLLTMALCGLWHGAGWHYILWGTLQGVGLGFAAIWRRYLPSPSAPVGWALTMIYFIGTGVFFRAETLDAAWHIYQGLAVLPRSHHTVILAAFCAFVLPSSHEICRRITTEPRYGVAAGLAAIGSLILLAINNNENYQFVYFQF